MGNLSYADVSNVVNSIWKDFAGVREKAERRYDLYRMDKDPYVPEEIEREGKMRVLSPLIIHATQTIRGELMMNPTEFSVVPLARDRDGSINKTMADKAETLERALAVLWGSINDGRYIDREVIWHQLVSPFACLILEFAPYRPPDQPEDMDDEDYLELVTHYDNTWSPFKVTVPDPLTCAWLERDGKPVIFVRKYKVLVRDLVNAFDKNPISEVPDKKLAFLDNRFKWVSDDMRPYGSSANSMFEEVEVIWMDDGEYIYEAVQHPGTDEGVVLASVKNPTGRPTGFVVPGNITPDRTVEDKYEPFLLPLMQAVNDINNIRSMRATAARNLAGPRTYVVLDPDIQKLHAQRGEPLPTEVSWKSNATPYLLGEVKQLPSELSEDWDKLEERIQNDLHLFLPSPASSGLDQATLRSATATSILHLTEASRRLYGPLISGYDTVIKDIMLSAIEAIHNGYIDQPIPLYATGEEHAGGIPVKEGAVFSLQKKTLGFSHKLIVRTRGLSRAQAAAQYEAALAQWILPDGTRGPATFDDLIDAGNYTDREAQRMKLAKEAILYTIDPWIQEMAIQGTRERIYMDSGIDVNLTSPAGVGRSESPAALPNAAQRFDAPMVTDAEGGSSPGLGGI